MKRLLLFILWVFPSFGLLGQNSFNFEDEAVLPGTKKHFKIPISDQSNETFIPITIFHGKEDGPVLGITAGVHGYEYAPILAGQALIQKIDPSTLKGTVILVQIANVASFLGRSPYVSPLDKINLNRAFPGKPDGTITEKIADFISKKVIARSNYFMDMHSGDAPEDLKAYSAYYHHDERKEASEKGRLMAQSLGFDHIVIFNTTQSGYFKEGFKSTYCSAEAFIRGIPAVDIECGRLGIIEKDRIEDIVSGVLSLLKQLEISEGNPTIAASIQYIDSRSTLKSKHTGFFYPSKASGEYVKKGMKIGHITDFFGETLETVHADQDGIILYMIGTPPVNQGETLLVVGEVE